jgi:hypothetical protein
MPDRKRTVVTEEKLDDIGASLEASRKSLTQLAESAKKATKLLKM